MNRSGKTITIFLVVISILLLSLAVISLYFYQEETQIRKAKETELAKVKAAKEGLEGELMEAKKQIFVLQEKEKEADERINSLLDDLELQEGLREEMKLETIALKEAINNENKEKGNLQNQVVALQSQIGELEAKLKTEENLRTDLETKIQESSQAKPEEKNAEIELEKIVI